MRDRDLPSNNRSERIFATNAALTNEIIAVRTVRSHFGPADSWVIRISGRQFLPRGIKSLGQTQGLVRSARASLSIRVR
jgi:hypothetical protein